MKKKWVPIDEYDGSNNYNIPKVQNSWTIQDIPDTNNIKFESSTKFVWKIEIDNFCTFFNLSDCNDSWEFVAKVTELQSELELVEDGILWPNTLEKIYLEYYMNNPDELSPEVLKRIEIYKNLKWYNQVEWALNWSLNVFNIKTFYWSDIWINKPWTYINEKLVGVFPESNDSGKSEIIFKNVDWKTALAFYVNWKLELATYCSPWLKDWMPWLPDWHETPILVTYWIKNPDMLHTSSEYPKIKDINWRVVEKWWAVMPYAVHIKGPLWIHVSTWSVDWWPRSNWCIRVWAFFMEHIFKLMVELWVENVKIDTTNIY